MKEYHYGQNVDSEIAITGVITNNSVEYLNDEIYSGIDLDYEEFLKSNPDDLGIETWEAYNSTYIIGKWIKHPDDTYSPDKTGEYSAIVGETYTQVVFSTFTKRCKLCSPCYPGQGDLDSTGEFLTYCLPDDLMGENK
jgi:hypothetical protein